MTDDDVNNSYLGRAVRMFSRIEGKPCVNIDVETGAIYMCRRIHGLTVNEGVVEGVCDWVDSIESRPGELTEGLAIGCDLLDVGDGWWYDICFDWYLVFDPHLVAQLLKDDHSWVPEFLKTTLRNRTVPRPAPNASGAEECSSGMRYFG